MHGAHSSSILKHTPPARAIVPGVLVLFMLMLAGCRSDVIQYNEVLVVDAQTNEPIPGALVLVVREDPNHPFDVLGQLRSTHACARAHKTDANGCVTIDFPANAPHKLAAWAQGHRAESVPLDRIKPDQQIDIPLLQSR